MWKLVSVLEEYWNAGGFVICLRVIQFASLIRDGYPQVGAWSSTMADLQRHQVKFSLPLNFKLLSIMSITLSLVRKQSCEFALGFVVLGV